jgi:acetyl-CoA carboxylase carboxyltransferase component
VGQKIVLAEQMANELRIPIVRLIDGAGGSVKSLEGMGRTYIPALPAWDWVVDNMAKVPVVALGLGTVAGINAARLVTSHYAIMVEGTSHMFMAGPPVLARLGETVTKDELGGGEIHVRSGAVDDMVSTEAEAFARTRRFLSFLPQSVYELPERTDPTDDVNRREEWLIDAIPKDLERSTTPGASFALYSTALSRWWKYGGSVITGLARLDGWLVAVIGSDPYIYAGGWTAAVFTEGHPLHRPGQHVPSARRAVHGCARLRSRRRGGESRNRSLWRARAGCALPGSGAVVHDHLA